MKKSRKLSFASLLRYCGIALLAVLLIVMFSWAIGAIYHDGPFRAFAWINAMAVIAGFIHLKPWKKKLMAFAVWFGIVLVAWHWQRPSNEGDWPADVSRLAYAEIDGDVVTLHNVRACDYRSMDDYTPHWNTRTVRLSQITGMDVVATYWGSEYTAHPFASFQFADAPPVCVSIEARKQKGQRYSALAALYRQYTLIYTVAEETDVLRLRTNFRPGNDVYLYRLNVSAAHARERFVEYLHAINRLHDHPRWYNVITTNCTTAVRQQRDAAKRIPFDWRMLVNGKGDELLYERDYVLKGGLPFDEWKRRSHINEAARSSPVDGNFSRDIRSQMPW